MFRTKKKKVGARKRRDVEVESESGAGNGPANVRSTPTGEIPTADGAVDAENDLQVLEKLRRNRSRSLKTSMSFSSKSSSARASVDDSHVATASVNGLLSFDDGENKTKQKRRKMRPNFVTSSSVDVEMEQDTVNQYSAEMLASLRSEQSVLLSSIKEEILGEVEIEVDAGNDEDVEKLVTEEKEEFISLEGGSKPRRGKNRVTFGTYSVGPEISKTTEVVEEISPEEDEEDEQNRRWEEELMRRGGHRVPQSEEKSSRSRNGQPIYPTRRQAACVSLGTVLAKLEKSLESTSFEDERASRELARLEAESALIETTLKQQQEELLVSSEEFEYFQDVEDFVKGLSFCLREKIPLIEEKERGIIDERAQRVKTILLEEQHGIAEEVKHYLGSGILQQTDVIGLDMTEGSTPINDAQHAARLLKYRQHFVESYVADPRHNDEDLFADAIDEINSLDRVYKRFQEWKAKFPEVYNNAYCELAQEKLFAPYVQAELLFWDPLRVADVNTKLRKTWSFDDFMWLQVLQQHVHQPGKGSAVDGPILYQVRDVVLEKVRIAVSRYFDPYSSLQARSLALVLEEISRHDYSAHVEEAVHTVVISALQTFSNEAKRTVLVAIGKNTADSNDDITVFARYLLERFNALQDNLLTLFVALPAGATAAAGFRCLLQVLHQLLAYVRHCHETQKTQLVAAATQVVRQLSGSSYLLQILSESSQERELKHMMALFAPFLQDTSQ
ncbi:GC-rich sequence DNA-binding factor 2 [Phytophthora citrophthora]|uniref:GC-rich sequence DNA-binding factor 2 n=1 Tax=Phytophthora citrophthora TaxID=4793 RepID=A0AAD9LT35_9STRA|nr:GC-rich sequence DNA-binding factor 2 [Phytophthora citrophthora]